MPPASTWPLTALRLVGEGDLEDALPTLIGPDAYERLCEDGLKLGELNALFERIGATAGWAEPPKFQAVAAARFDPDVEAR